MSPLTLQEVDRKHLFAGQCLAYDAVFRQWLLALCLSYSISVSRPSVKIIQSNHGKQ